MATNDFPAMMIFSRYSPTYNPPLLVKADGKVLHSEADLTQGVNWYARIEAAGGIPYTLTVAPLADVDEAVADIAEALALDVAMSAARAAFSGDRATLRRLERARRLVEAGAVTELGGGEWLVSSQNGAGSYTVNGACECLDFEHRGGYCKHRLATFLVRKMRELQNNGALGADTTKAPAVAPEETNSYKHDTTDFDRAQTCRHSHDRESECYMADPDQCQGCPHYEAQPDPETALPFQYTRGRAKLFKD